MNSTDIILFVHFFIWQKPTEEQFPTKANDLQYVSRGMMFLRKEHSGLAAQARSILAWNIKYAFLSYFFIGCFIIAKEYTLYVIPH